MQQATNAPAIAEEGASSTRPGYLAPPEPPVSEPERYLAALWEATLGIRPIGRNDDFFALGGGSRDAAAIFARIASERGLTLPLALLVTHPTIAQLAPSLTAPETAREAEADILVPIRQNGKYAPFFVVHGFGGEVLSARALADPMSADIPLYGIRARERAIGKFTLDRGVAQIAADYVARIRRLQPQGPYYFGGYCAGGIIAFEMAAQLRRMGERVGLLVMIDASFIYAMSPSRRIAHRARHHLDMLRRDGFASIKRSFDRWNRRRATRRMIDERRAAAGLATQGGVAREKAERREAIDMDHSYMPDQYREQFYALLERYRPPVYDGDVLMVNTPGIIDLTGDRTLGWGWRIKGKLRVEIVDVHHNYILRAPATDRIAALVHEAYGIAAGQRPEAATASGAGEITPMPAAPAE